MAQRPNISFVPNPDGRIGVVMFAAGTAGSHRWVMADTPEQAERLITSVSISEFGMEQDEARMFARGAVHSHVSTLEPAARIRQLEQQLEESQTEAAANKKAMIQAKADLEQARFEMAKERAPLDKRVTDLTARALAAEAAVRMETTENERLAREISEISEKTSGAEQRQAGKPSP